MNMKKYEGIMPALYACYDDNGAVSIERTKALEIQNECCRIIYKLCSGHGYMYGMIKAAVAKYC